MKYIVAVSGGVDSVVLLDMLAKTDDTIIVAHVEHGIRSDSADDARFVCALAQKYGATYEQVSLGLGAAASEQVARQARYEFLFKVAKKHQAVIATAHHGDDLAETIAINVTRGTGWRGVAVLNRVGVYRPLLTYSKADLYDYAVKNRLEWVEDATNRDQRYLRNRVRAQLRPRITPVIRKKLGALREAQVELAKAVNSEAATILSQNKVLRYLLIHSDKQTAIELLGQALYSRVNLRPQTEQLERALVAIKTAKPGTTCHVGDKIILRFTTRDFSVEVLQ